MEALDRRLFLRGLMLTSAGLILPKPSLFALPKPVYAPVYGRDIRWSVEETSLNDPRPAIAAFNDFIKAIQGVSFITGS